MRPAQAQADVETAAPDAPDQQQGQSGQKQRDQRQDRRQQQRGQQQHRHGQCRHAQADQRVMAQPQTPDLADDDLLDAGGAQRLENRPGHVQQRIVHVAAHPVDEPVALVVAQRTADSDHPRRRRHQQQVKPQACQQRPARRFGVAADSHKVQHRHQHQQPSPFREGGRQSKPQHQHDAAPAIGGGQQDQQASDGWRHGRRPFASSPAWLQAVHAIHHLRLPSCPAFRSWFPCLGFPAATGAIVAGRTMQHRVLFERFHCCCATFWIFWPFLFLRVIGGSCPHIPCHRCSPVPAGPTYGSTRFPIS
ncbi:hypothetical protein TSH100_08330 [Azospirillum sp. TSH100]|nr:hypothetical protein TSH100_08330 [Azospirillum sp. TSH100]